MLNRVTSGNRVAVVKNARAFYLLTLHKPMSVVLSVAVVSFDGIGSDILGGYPGYELSVVALMKCLDGKTVGGDIYRGRIYRDLPDTVG